MGLPTEVPLLCTLLVGLRACLWAAGLTRTWKLIFWQCSWPEESKTALLVNWSPPSSRCARGMYRLSSMVALYLMPGREKDKTKLALHPHPKWFTCLASGWPHPSWAAGSFHIGSKYGEEEGAEEEEEKIENSRRQGGREEGRSEPCKKERDGQANAANVARHC